jgi:TRAP-type transport system periplasmic protein
MTKRLVITAALTAALGVVGIGHAKELKIGLITPPPHLWTVEANALAESMKKASNGAYTIAVYPSGQLGNEAQMLQQLQTGALDMAFMTMAEISNRVPNMGAFFAPYLVKDVAGAAKLLRSEAAQTLLSELPSKVGVVGLGYGMAGMRQLNSRKPVQSAAADLRGKKVRITPFEPTRDFHNLLGVAPTPMPLPAVYDALANGQVDAIEMDVENMVKQKYYDVAPYILLSRHMMFPMVAVVSSRTWAALPEAGKALLNKHTQEHLNRQLDTMVIKEAEWTADLKKTKATVIEVGPEFFGDAIAKWEKIWAKKAPALRVLRAEAAKIR